MGKVTESIYDGKTVVIPMAEVIYIEKRDKGIAVIMQGTTFNHGAGDYNNSAWIGEAEQQDFITAWCQYRHELEAGTLVGLALSALS